MPYFNIVAETSENTVVTEYEPVKKRSDSYQSEAELEQEFIRLLCEQGYEYLPIHTEKDLIANLRKKLEELNNYQFSDTEWNDFFKNAVANPNEHIVEKTRKIQEDNIQVLTRDDVSSKNITLIDKKNIHNNRLQVINQYVIGTENGAKHDNRYDVTVLVNGLPLVHIELKRRGVAIREAFNQINRYQRDSFWAGCGLYEYIQIFVISNGTNTKYYSNSTRRNAEKEHEKRGASKTKTSNSFEFTCFWADANNRVIPDLIDFTKTFFAKHTILNILTKYCIFTSEDMLMVMRPYQITATERILNRIEIANNYKKYGSVEGGGYIWHTTGSGKTLTSFKTARLASKLPYIDKVLFVVDRKDLDYQTMKEYDRFEKGAANSNTSTTILKRQLEDPDAHIIITTIQKLATFIKKNPGHEVYTKHIVIIFDECHRSQFGDMHTAIVKNFKKYHLFGFTGTPIFSVNSGRAKNPEFFTTGQTFGDQLHSYTIVDAINDKNVLPFRVDYIKTMDVEEEITDEMVWDINREKVMMAPERIRIVTQYILEHFDQKTYRGDKTYIYNTLTNIAEVASAKRDEVEEIKQKQRISGFNSIFAVSSVLMAKLYYQEFKKQMAADPTKKLRVATIFSYGANEEESDGILDEENSEDTSALDQPSREFLEEAIDDYVDFLVSSTDIKLDGIKLAIDCANGATYKAAPMALERLGAEVVAIHREPDGTNINLNCGSTHMEDLCQFVKENDDIQLGIAFDGDGDRCLACDGNGNMVDGDVVMAICAKHMKDNGKLKNNTIVATVMSNMGLFKMGRENGIKVERTKVGDRYVLEHILENGDCFGGEQSGHIIFSKYASTGDGILTSLKMMEVMMARKKKMSELLDGLTIYPQVLENVRVTDKKAAQDDADVQAAVKAVTEALGDTGRILVRESGTEPLLRVMVEAETEEVCRKYVDQVVDVVKAKGHIAS